jgi:hypothetical protein
MKIGMMETLTMRKKKIMSGEGTLKPNKGNFKIRAKEADTIHVPSIMFPNLGSEFLT